MPPSATDCYPHHDPHRIHVTFCPAYAYEAWSGSSRGPAPLDYSYITDYSGKQKPRTKHLLPSVGRSELLLWATSYLIKGMYVLRSPYKVDGVASTPRIS